MMLFKLIAISSCANGITFELDGDNTEYALFAKFFEETGNDVSELGVKQMRFGGLGQSGNLSARRQALIRIMFNVISGNEKKDKSYMRKFFQYGCHCYPGGPDHLLRSGHGRPLDKIDTICQKHKNCYKCMNAIFNAGRWALGSKTNCNPENTTYKMIVNTEARTVFCPSEQTLCRKSLCECDREFAMSIEALDIETEYNPLYLKRNGFDQDANCPKLANGISQELKCCGDKSSFPNVEPLSGQKDECCQTRSYNSVRYECCEDNNVVPIGTCLSQPTGYTP